MCEKVSRRQRRSKKSERKKVGPGRGDGQGGKNQAKQAAPTKLNLSWLLLRSLPAKASFPSTTMALFDLNPFFHT